MQSTNALSIAVVLGILTSAARSGEEPAAPVFIDGRKALTLRGAQIAREFQDIVEDYVKSRYGTGEQPSATGERRDAPLSPAAAG